MAIHTWTSGESITASKLNAIEKRRAWTNGELPLTSLTWNEAVQLIEDVGDCRYSYYHTDSFYKIQPFNTQVEYHATDADELLEPQLPK